MRGHGANNLIKPFRPVGGVGQESWKERAETLAERVEECEVELRRLRLASEEQVGSAAAAAARPEGQACHRTGPAATAASGLDQVRSERVGAWFPAVTHEELAAATSDLAARAPDPQHPLPQNAVAGLEDAGVAGASEDPSGQTARGKPLMDKVRRGTPLSLISVLACERHLCYQPVLGGEKSRSLACRGWMRSQRRWETPLSLTN